MKTLKARTDFRLNNEYYAKGDEVQTREFKDIILMNEKGFIEPLNAKDLSLIKKELNKSKINKEEA